MRLYTSFLCTLVSLVRLWNASLARTYDISALNGSIRADTACLTLVGSALASKRLTSTTDSCRRDATCIMPWILKCALGEIISRFKIEVVVTFRVILSRMNDMIYSKRSNDKSHVKIVIYFQIERIFIFLFIVFFLLFLEIFERHN